MSVLTLCCYWINYRRTLSFGILLMLLFITTTDSCFPGGRLIRRLPKKEPPLVYKQHVPNVPETMITASGPREGRIKRHDRRFKELVNNHNPDIIFKDEEATGADRIMSLRCKEKLDALAMLVMNYWPGVKLRVTEAWDEEQFHTPDSLHYEGRAVDITTSDRDRNKYGPLARLAVQAGFDWVHFEQRGHVHASVKSDTLTRNKRTLRCFPENSTVVTRSGTIKPISALRTGEYILSVSKNDNKPTYSQVITFLHIDKTSSEEFLQIQTENGTRLSVSADHLLYKLDTCNGVASLKLFTSVFVKNLVLGDYIFVYDKMQNNTFSPEKIISISSVILKGLYAPWTTEGTLVVDGVAASCYSAVRSETVAHTVMAPLRLVYSTLNFVENNFHINFLSSSSSNEGVHWYANLLWSLAELIENLKLHSFLDSF